MASIRNVLSALTEFLNEAQRRGIIKEFTLIQCEQLNENAYSEADEVLSKFLDKIRCMSAPTEINNYSVTDCAREEKSEDKQIIESPPVEKSFVEMQVEINEVSTESSSSSITEYIEVTDQEEKSESCSTSHSSMKENLIQMQDNKNEVSTESSSSSITEHIEVTDQEEKSESCSTSHSSMKENLIQMQDNKNELSKMEDHFKEKDLIQIRVGTIEMRRRISAFISRKRKEVDEWNVQEFCGRSYFDEEDPSWALFDSCARVDAVFVPRRDSKSHIKVSKVKNASGPQTQSQEAKKIKQDPCEIQNHPNDASLQTIEERLHNMESHLKLKSDSSLRSNVFQRLKDLENRILLLESTSPEYIHLPNSDYSSPKKKNNFDKEKVYLNSDADELKKRIQSLKESFKGKSPQIKSEPFF